MANATPRTVDFHTQGAHGSFNQEMEFVPELNLTVDGATVITLVADADRKNVIGQITCSYSAAPTGGSIKIEDVSGTVVWGPHTLGGTGPYVFDFNPPLANALKNTELIITLADGGGAITGCLSVSAWKRK